MCIHVYYTCVYTIDLEISTIHVSVQVSQQHEIVYKYYVHLDKHPYHYITVYATMYIQRYLDRIRIYTCIYHSRQILHMCSSLVRSLYYY